MRRERRSKEERKNDDDAMEKLFSFVFLSLSRARVAYLDGVGHVGGQLLGALVVASPGVGCELEGEREREKEREVR